MEKVLKRRVKVENGKVTSHAPLNDKTAINEAWPIVTVPDSLPGEPGLNGLMGADALNYDAGGGELTWPGDWQAKVIEHQKPKPNDLEVLAQRVAELEVRIVVLEAAGK